MGDLSLNAASHLKDVNHRPSQPEGFSVRYHRTITMQIPEPAATKRPLTEGPSILGSGGRI